MLVALPTGWDWLDAWLGALRLGALPAAAAPPGAVGARAGSLRRLAALRDVVDARRIAAPPAARDALREEGRDDVAARVATPEELEAASSSAAPVADLPRPRPEEIAFLQFTSGSTGTARAVRIPHAAVLHNNRVSADAIGAPWGRPAETWARGMAAWLPLHHDMGLVGCLFLSIALRRTSRCCRPRRSSPVRSAGSSGSPRPGRHSRPRRTSATSSASSGSRRTNSPGSTCRAGARR